jgi:ABC-2 type transport system ATP-binding protein
MKSKIRELILELNKKKNTTVILTTHDMGDVDALCRRIVIIDKGKKLYDNDIQHLRGFFGSYRTLKIRPKEEIKTAAAELEKELKDLDIKVSISDDNEWINLLVNEDKIKVLDVLGKVQSMHDIRDMQLEEISTEEVIKKIYEGGI